MTIVALIPARQGSKRVQGKNIRNLGGIPLIGHTISMAIESKIFSKVIVSTDSIEIATISETFGALVPSLRPSDIAHDSSPDFSWVDFAIKNWLYSELPEYLAILRPTSPFRTRISVEKAFSILKSNPDMDSIRAMRLVTEHPGKMWILDENNRAEPLMNLKINGTPGHSMPFQSLPEIWVQDASLEIARTSSIRRTRTISGNAVLGFKMPNFEGFDINTEKDFEEAEKIFTYLQLRAKQNG